jgi:hypothetical protein
MLESLKNFKNQNFDSYAFLPSEEDQIHFQGSNYVDPGEKLDGSEMGDCYHVILFKEGEDGQVIHLDKFDAILTAPLEYISRLLPDGWLGVISRKTTTSEKYMQETFDTIKEAC